MNTLREAVQDYLVVRRDLGFKLREAGQGLLCLAISSIPQLGGSPSESVPGAHWQASPLAESQRCPRTQFSFNTVCP
jgi:hypothetical protein